MSSFPLTVLAGPDALAELRDQGLLAHRVRAFVGASGGPKWLVLHGLDRVLMPWLLTEARPIHAIGSSIGSWRAACLSTPDPISVIDRLAEAYIEQRYEKNPAPEVVSAEGARILEHALGIRDLDQTLHRMLQNPKVRLHIVTTRFRHLGAREGTAQLLGLGMAIMLNSINRRALSASIERVVFDVDSDPGPFTPWRSLPTRHVSLTPENIIAALHASAAIPLVMAGVVNPPGAPPGTYRDGGVADYHFGAEIDLEDGLTLYPHFYPHLVPGWFDKSFPWRRTRGLRRAVVISPSASLVESLPHGRIPDRKDFDRMSDRDRMNAWRAVLAASARMGEAFASLTSRRTLGDLVRPLP